MASQDIDPVAQELNRIFGKDVRAADSNAIFAFSLPVGDEAHVVAFLRSVPSGTSSEELNRLAAAYRVEPSSMEPDADGIVPAFREPGSPE